MKNDSEFENAQSLEAWNEWKEKCAVGSCSEPKYRQILTREIGSAFRKKLYCVVKGHLNVLAEKSDDKKSNDNLSREDAENLIFVQEFDTGILEKAEAPGIDKRNGKEKKKKHYKDLVWTKVEESNDPPLKVIRGMLLGSVSNKKSPLNTIVREYVEKNFSINFYTKGNKRHLDALVSLQDELYKDSEGNSIKVEESKDASNFKPLSLQDFEFKFIDAEMNKLTDKEAALLLAVATGIPKTSEELLKYLEWQKSQACQVFNEALGKLRELLLKEFSSENYSAAVKYIIEKIILRLKMEKRAKHFLMRVRKSLLLDDDDFE